MHQQISGHSKTMLQIIDDSSMGGAENHTRLITKEFARRGYKVLLLCPHGPYVERFQELTQYGVEILPTSLISKHYMNPFHGFDLIRLIRAVKFIRRLIIARNIELIHSHKHPADLLIALSTIGIGHISKITTIHSLENKDKFWLWRKWRYLFIRTSLLQFDWIFAVSENVRSNTIQYFSIPSNKVVTMMNGIDPSELDPDLSKEEIKQKHKIEANQFVILCAGKVEYRKGQDILLCAISKIIKSHEIHKDIVVLFAGNADIRFKKKLVLLANELGIIDCVIFVGYEENISNILQIADLYVQPSRWDPLPRALMEAMGMGIPSIGSNVDGISELIEHEKTGLLFKNEDADDLVRKIEKSLLCPKLRKSWSEKAVKKVNKQHTIHTMADTIESELYGENFENRS